MSQPYVGEIRMVGFSFAPAGWSFCNGSILSISQFSTLFTIIGTTYGGDGQQTFALPDLRGRIPVHQGSDPVGNPYIIGQMSGSEAVTLDLAQVPAHSHSLRAQAAAGKLASPSNAFWAASPLKQFASGPPSATMGPALQLTGGDQPHPNMPTFQVINFVIALFGIFPSQN